MNDSTVQFGAINHMGIIDLLQQIFNYRVVNERNKQVFESHYMMACYN